MLVPSSYPLSEEHWASPMFLPQHRSALSAQHYITHPRFQTRFKGEISPEGTDDHYHNKAMGTTILRHSTIHYATLEVINPREAASSTPAVTVYEGNISDCDRRFSLLYQFAVPSHAVPST
jgi:hypothetical protein